MGEAMTGLLADAKKNKFSTIRDTLSEDDVAAVWENVSSFIEKTMSQQKGVQIQSLGTFTFSQKKLDIGNNKFLLIQRPVFNISEKFAQSQGLQYAKAHVPGHIPVVQLNYAALSFESPYDRDSVESCVREILNAVTRAVGAKKNVELTFNGIGRLSIRDSKVKMKFYKEFITQMDGSGKLMDSLQNRPGTTDSVISDRAPSRPHSVNTVILPRIPNKEGGGGLAPVAEMDENEVGVRNGESHEMQMPTELQGWSQGNAPPMEDFAMPNSGAPPYIYNTADGIEEPEFGDVATAAAIRNIEYTGEPMDVSGSLAHIPHVPADTEQRPAPQKSNLLPSRSASRTAVPMAKATGVSLLDDLYPSAQSPKSAPSMAGYQPHQSPSGHLLDNAAGDSLPFKPKPPSPKLQPLQRSHSLDQLKPGDKVATPPGSACGHPNAGQELCYLCHQRSRRNIPVSFAEEKKRRDEEEEKLVQQYQAMKDAEDILTEQEKNLAMRQNLQKMAAFNIGVAEALHAKKRSRDKEFHKSYIFQRRPLTPPRIRKQEEYSGDLAKQVKEKDDLRRKKKSDDEFLERLEQVQLAEDLAAQREQYLREQAEDMDKYKQALEAQLRFKPLQVPPREPDNEVFGKNDMTNEKMAERRRRAYDLFQEQQDLVAHKKREAILKRLAEQREEEDVLDQTKKDVLEDRAARYSRRLDARKRLENEWAQAALYRQNREMEERIRAMSPGILLHEQCDKYHRCRQCQRKINNCGESNIWSESRYIPGSRLMV
ncbi:hypothetical protein CHS0354_032249 [Potamilus streckersoni]|uniref:Coiled-coil domain-containing protein 81 n=1 Tax=Potamilus streckersoni TaxID=2493646 RepID=A0AAE0RPZ8_9BIVA|nr:hypothetical protein CHS0354_032249 [Potamilus streckersoni]